MDVNEQLRDYVNADDDQTFQEVLKDEYDDPAAVDDLLQLLQIIVNYQEERRDDLREDVKTWIRNHKHMEDGETVEGFRGE